jgi:hypothetical protein
MAAKAADYQANIEVRHLVDGQLVSRRADGSADDEGDAATYTSYYIVAQAYRYQATGSAEAYANVEAGLTALHRMFAASGMPGVPSRFVYADGRPYVPNPENHGSFASKDMFTAVPYAFNMAVPILREGPVKTAALGDVRAMADNFLAHDFAFTGANPALGVTQFESFHPGLTLAELEDLARNQPGMLTNMVDALAKLGAIGNRRTRIGSRDYPLVAIGLAFMGVYYKSIGDHWDDWRYFYERGMARSEYDWMRANLTREDYYSLSRLLWDTWDFSRPRGLYYVLVAPAARPDWRNIQDAPYREMSGFFYDLFTAQRNNEAILNVIRQHWSAGFNTYLNTLLRTIKEMPDAVPSFIIGVAHQLGTRPEDLVARLAPAQSFGVLAMPDQAVGGELPGEFERMRAFISDSAAAQILSLASPSEDGPLAMEEVVAAQSSDDDTYLGILDGVGRVWSVMTDVLVGAESVGGVPVAAVREVETQADAGNGSLGIELLKRWFANDRGNRAVLKQYTSAIPDVFSSPDQLQVIPGRHLLQLHVLSVAARLTGDVRYQQTYEQQRARLLGPTLLLTTAGDDIVRRILGDEINNAALVKGTHNVPWVAIHDLLANETDTSASRQYQQIVAKMFDPIRNDRNAYASWISYRYGGNPTRDMAAATQGVDSLVRFPSYGPLDFDYTTPAGLAVVEREFGGLGPLFPGIDRGTRNAVPTDKRPRDSFTWQRSPRRLTGGNPAGKTFAGADYLLPFWMGKALNVLPGCGDCNHNGVEDCAEIANNSATDCDGNGVLDDCEAGARAVLYVDLNNTRCQNGSEAFPFRTVQKAHAVAAAGTTIRIRSGRYPERLTLIRPVRLESQGGPVSIGP